MHEKYVGEYDLAAHFGAVRERKRVLFERQIRRLPACSVGARLCDVGCADGQFLEMAREQGWQCYGVELNPPAAAGARATGLTVFEGEFELLDGLPWGTFDVVTCWDCLEHTPEPRVFAARLAALARPGATLMITTLNVGALAFRVFGSRWSMVVEDHFTYWGKRSLERLFAHAGCEMIECRTYALGRDFVVWLDTLQRRVRGPARPAPGHLASGGGNHRGWDVTGGVLAAERIVNAMLETTDSGVVIAATFRRA